MHGHAIAILYKRAASAKHLTTEIYRGGAADRRSPTAPPDSQLSHTRDTPMSNWTAQTHQRHSSAFVSSHRNTRIHHDRRCSGAVRCGDRRARTRRAGARAPPTGTPSWVHARLCSCARRCGPEDEAHSHFTSSPPWPCRNPPCAERRVNARSRASRPWGSWSFSRARCNRKASCCRPPCSPSGC